MLELLKRLLGVEHVGSELRGIESWAKARGASLKRVRDQDGVVLEGSLHGSPWRMELGPPQRGYIASRELRLRMELRLPQSLQMAVVARSLAEHLEQSAYQLFTQDNQTRVDTDMPEEMRWLAMFPKAHLAVLKPLKARFVVVADRTEPLEAWITGSFLRQLEVAANRWLAPDQPFLLMTLRGRIYLRLEARDTERSTLDGVMNLFEAAAYHALAVAEEGGGGSPDSALHSTAWGPLPPSR